MHKKRLAVLTSGGDAPGMNAAIRAVTRKGLYHGFEVFAVEHGYQGLVNGEFSPMQLSSVAGIISQGGTVLRTARSELFKTEEGFAKAVWQIKEQGIDVLVVIGGDGSMRGAQKLAATGVSTVVIPASIDNDMPGTEYCIGFDTALNTILDAVSKIRDTIASHDRVAVVEVMGRNSGQLALLSGIACGSEAIFLPEIPMDIQTVCDGLIESFQRGKKYSIVLVAEGAGKGQDIAARIAACTKFSTHVTVLGYIQRGGSPSATDNIMASRMGAIAVDAILRGEVNFLVALREGHLVSVPYGTEADFRPSIDVDQYNLVRILAT
jgi:6-phosphofructokinase 1